MKFFERFRTAVGKYAEGVHLLGPAATGEAVRQAEARLGRRLPDEQRDFLQQWNGAELFHEALLLHGAEALVLVGEAVDIGRTETGRLWLHDDGRVVEIDEETERAWVVGSRFDRWLDATMAREGLLYDREGEFRDAAFDGGELTERVRRKRAGVGLKADPESPAFHVELALLDEEAGDLVAARAGLERAVALDPRFAEAWFALARLREVAGESAAALDAFARAGRAEAAGEEAAFALAHATRVARAIGDEAAGTLAAEALSRHPSFVAEQRAAAEHLVGERDLEAALDRLALAQAVAPEDAELGRVSSLLRARRALAPRDSD